MSRRHLAYAAYGLLLLAALGVAASNPLLFQKLNTLRPAPAIPDLDTSRGSVDIEALIRPIPIQNTTVWNVHPETRYRQTILQGGGNCSQMVFGLAYRLNRDGIDYQIIHMLTPEGIAEGDGHTVIRIPYRYAGDEGVGLLDVSFGILLAGPDGPLDVEQVEAAPVPGWGSIPLNEAARFPSYHDEDEFLPRAHLGYIPTEEVRDYYAFLDRVYFSTGHSRAEKYFFDGLALLFGKLPEVFVPQYDLLLADRRLDLVWHRGALWVMRTALLVLPLLVLFEIWRAARPGNPR